MTKRFWEKLHVHPPRARSERAPSSPVSTSRSQQNSEHDLASKDEHSSEVRLRKALKLLLVTWNMHDSVPHGDLTDLLGPLPSPDTPLPVGETDDSLPVLEHNEGHFYHLVVVCGQETAGGGRWTERLDEFLCKGITQPVNPDETLEDFPGTPRFTSAELHAESSEHTSPPGQPNLAPPLHGINRSQTVPVHSHPVTPPATNSSQHKVAPQGPYVLVTKERLMGIYIAVFVLRTAEHLITGHDKATVTAGLLGGRVGNKGCAAISMHIASTRLLFISAHLAAHQEGSNHRKENVMKIQNELCIDDFSGRRKSHHDAHVKRDVTGSFDCSFWSGDLNYRVDVSRLHADWLVRTQDWRTALQFDQLKPLLGKAGTCWAHWKEGEIDFAPTFKYDLIKLERTGTLERKHSLRHLPSGVRRKRAGTTSALPSGASTPLAAPIVENGGPSRNASVRSSVTSFHEALNNGHAHYRSSSVDEDKDLRSQLIDALYSASAGSSTSAASLEKPSRYESQSSAEEDEAAFLQVAHRMPTDASNQTVSSSQTTADPDATYDTSKKQRVQSWCDRILWRSNMVTAGPPTSPKVKSGGLISFLASAKQASMPSSETDEERQWSLPRRFVSPSKDQPRDPLHDTDATISPKSMSPTASPTLSNGHAEGRSLTSPDSPTRKASPDENLHKSEPFYGRPRSRSAVTTASENEKQRKTGFGFNLFPAISNDPRSPVEDGRRGSVIAGWKQWLMGANASRSPVDRRASTPTPRPVQLSGPKRGEVEVLQYTSVTDMRKLLALSDHRAVRAVMLLGLSDKE